MNFLFHILSGLSEDVDKSNNKESLQVPVKFEADLSIVG